MNLFRKKTTLPEGPARMSVSPSASKKEIGNPAASIGLVIPEAPNYDEERGRQLARSDSYATFFKTGVGLFYHETACTAEKHLAEIEEALPATPKRWNPPIAQPFAAKSSRPNSVWSASPRNAQPARLVKPVKLAKPVRHAHLAQPSRRRSRP